MSTHVITLAAAAALAVMASFSLACAEDAGAPGAPPGQTIVPVANGGFETWEPLDQNAANSDYIKSLKLIPENQGPKAWGPFSEDTRERHMTGTVAMDEEVRHSGLRSVRIENGLKTDICGVSYSTEQFAKTPEDPRNIKPNRHYLLRWWVKGENVDGNGPLLMMCGLSGKNGALKRADSYEQGVALPTGTFDWQRRAFTFITDPEARWVVFSFQLRWASGKIWYDDVELIDLGPVVHVETY